MRPRSAFTLTELLVVVAVIAILAAIALPNFLDALTRSRVSRAKADLRSIAIGMESYLVDHNVYPSILGVSIALSTPVAYLTSTTWEDPFAEGDPRPDPTSPTPRVYGYGNLRDPLAVALLSLTFNQAEIDQFSSYEWFTSSRGPDGDLESQDPMANYAVTGVGLMRLFNQMANGTLNYDPTNGTLSEGDIVITQRGFLTAELLR